MPDRIARLQVFRIDSEMICRASRKAGRFSVPWRDCSA